MDIPTANQSQTPCHTWVGQEGWSPPSCTQLPSFQHLTLGSTSDQRPRYGHHQASVPGTLQVNNAQQKHTPPSHFSHGQHRAMSPPFLVSHTHTHQMLQNAAYSPNEEHTHIVSRVPGPDAFQNPACSPEPALGLGNVKTSDGFGQSPASPTSPTCPLQQPPDGVSSHYIGLFIRIIRFKKTNNQIPDANQGPWSNVFVTLQCVLRFVYLKFNRLLCLGNINSHDGDIKTQVRKHNVCFKKKNALQEIEKNS